MRLSNDTLTLLVFASLALAALALYILAVGRPRGRGGVGPSKGGSNLDEHERAIAQLQEAVRELSREDQRLAGRLTHAVQHVGMIRYDAFDDMGGRLSFSAAFLDAEGNGVVITSINGRQDTRCYSKPVQAGASNYNLSDEEEQAIRQALAGAVAAS